MALSGRESSLVQTFCESCEQLDITHPSIHMTRRFVIQGCPILKLNQAIQRYPEQGVKACRKSTYAATAATHMASRFVDSWEHRLLEPLNLLEYNTILNGGSGCQILPYLYIYIHTNMANKTLGTSSGE